MAHLVACDLPGCSQVNRDEGRLGWLTVEREDNVNDFSKAPGPWYFCSWEHLGRFGLLRAEKWMALRASS